MILLHLHSWLKLLKTANKEFVKNSYYSKNETKKKYFSLQKLFSILKIVMYIEFSWIMQLQNSSSVLTSSLSTFIYSFGG